MMEFNLNEYAESRILHWHILEITNSVNGKKFLASINTLKLKVLPEVIKYHKLTISEIKIVQTLEDRNEARAIANEFPFS